LCGCGGPARAAAPSPPAPSVGQRLNAPLPAALRDQNLVEDTGKQVDLGSFAGKVVVISDVMTLCQETCPLDTANVVAAARAVERAGLGSKVEFLSITVDPVRDTPTRLAAYRRLFTPVPADWVTLTGTPSSIAGLWKRLGVYTKKVPDTPPAPRDWLTGKPLTYDITHSDELFFLDQRTHERLLLDGAPHLAPGTKLPRTLDRFLDATGHRNVTHPDPAAWTLPQELHALGWLTGHPIT
jgi:protein SCO1/2